MAKKDESTAVVAAESVVQNTALSLFPTLQPGSEMAEVIEMNYGDEPMKIGDLIAVKTPSGGATSWTIETPFGETTEPELKGLLVYYGKAGVLWGSQDPEPGSLPLLQTSDLRWARMLDTSDNDAKYGDLDKSAVEACRDDETGLYDWLKLPYNEYGSGRKGHGKRCQEIRNLCILREGEAMPMLFRCKPGSLKNVTKFIKQLTAIGLPWNRAVISLTLSKATSKGGQTFSQVNVKLVDKLGPETKTAIENLYTNPLREAFTSQAITADTGLSSQDDLE